MDPPGATDSRWFVQGCIELGLRVGLPGNVFSIDLARAGICIGGGDARARRSSPRHLVSCYAWACIAAREPITEMR